MEGDERSGSALTFDVGTERLAIAADRVTEVLRQPRLVRPPLAPSALAGVVGLRGRVIPVVALSQLLAQDGTARSSEQRVIVVEHDGPVGLLVDRVSAMVPQGRIGSPEQPGRMVDLPALLESGFGQLSSVGRAEATVHKAAPALPAILEAEEKLLTFDVGGQEFGLPLTSVAEVVTLPPDVAELPRTDGAMRGVMALRGRLLPLVNLAVLLGLESHAAGEQRAIVAELGGTEVGLVVEHVRGIVRVPAAAIDPVPLVLTRGNQEAQVQSVCRLEGGQRLISVLSTDHLLRDGLAERLREAAMAQGTQEEEAEVAGTEQLLVFTLGENSYGLPLASVEEVARVPERLSRLPKAPPFIDGVMDLRGRVIPVIDQARRFDLAESPSSRRRVVVVRIGEDSAGFVVDAVSGIVRLADSDLQDSPGLVAQDSAAIHRIGMVEGGGMIFLIDPHELLDKAERDMVTAMREDRSAPA
ncbi:chemotaxis protein CheW [Sphingomonas sp. BN140010]|uniref:Chemotaxis protein CheW n=1 Tax=Sphingomonas arvum TaxID=2992113 RepID=A0ABT3JBB0_9SPHN|nr:chemotaxis protein CheW [Sphingomonas sp. BN140010]MCW3796332.1 chemotaxis protein CheW [Sphingomonas sp. BN140010]